MSHCRSFFLTASGSAIASFLLQAGARAESVPLRIGAPFSDSFGTPFYIKDAGTFVKAGFEVEVVNLTNAAAVMAALAGGSLDLGIGDLVSSTNAINRGVPIELLAPCGLYLSAEPTVWIAVAKNSTILRPRDLEGKSLAVPTIVGLTTAAVRAWLSRSGADPEKVRIVEGGASAPIAVIRGTFDAGAMVEPFYTPVKNQLRVIGQPYDAIAKVFVLSAWFAQRSWIESDRERTRRVITAIYDTARWANAHHSETLAILARDGKMDPDQIKDMARTTYATNLVPAQVQAVLDVAAKFNLIAQPVKASAIMAPM